MNLASILYNLGALLGIFALALTDILWLRIIFALSTLFLMTAGILYHLTAMIIWNVIYSGVNIGQIIIYILNTKKIIIPAELKIMYQTIFSSLTTREFLYFVKVGNTKEEEDVIFCKEGDTLSSLFLLVQGQAGVVSGNKVIATLIPGQFIGEMRFIAHKPISADVKAVGKVRYIVWSHDQLEKIHIKNPDLFMKILIILGKDLVKKIYETSQKKSTSSE